MADQDKLTALRALLREHGAPEHEWDDSELLKRVRATADVVGYARATLNHLLQARFEDLATALVPLARAFEEISAQEREQARDRYRSHTLKSGATQATRTEAPATSSQGPMAPTPLILLSDRLRCAQ